VRLWWLLYPLLASELVCRWSEGSEDRQYVGAVEEACGDSSTPNYRALSGEFGVPHYTVMQVHMKKSEHVVVAIVGL
jgi:hypothetical protein